mmetsp:Transcript_3482/g.4283  ORF Transcript_3482/g.4283 Transcript_3482/m.4283 type:complete len:291 (+) Transcript_3482:128-1000(+)
MNQMNSCFRPGGSSMILLSVTVLLAFSEWALPAEAFTASTGPSFTSKFRTDQLYVGRNGRSFEQSDRFNYETDFADRIGGTPNPDSWSQPVNGMQRRRRGVPYRAATANIKATDPVSPTSVTNKDETRFSEAVEGTPETDQSKLVDLDNSRRQVQRSAPISKKRSTVNGMYNYETDFADRIGSTPDVDSWSRPVNEGFYGFYGRQRQRRAVPAVQAPPPISDPEKRSNPVNAMNTTQRKMRNTFAGVSKKGTVNGMNNYETDFADRIGSSPDVDAWSRPAVNGLKIRRKK